MRTQHTRQGCPYRCQSKASYLALEAIELIVGLFGGGATISSGRRYVIEAREPYDGQLTLKCRSKIGFRVDESQVYNKSPELQKKLLHSYMDLNNSSRIEVPGLEIEKALLPSLGAIKDIRPEIVVVPGQSITIQVERTTRWDIPENVVDEEYAVLTKEVHRLALAFGQIESTIAADDVKQTRAITT